MSMGQTGPMHAFLYTTLRTFFTEHSPEHSCIYIFAGILLHEFTGTQWYIFLQSEVVQDLVPNVNSIRHFKVTMHHCGTISGNDNLMYVISNQSILNNS
jgi:hypothetical protein